MEVSAALFVSTEVEDMDIGRWAFVLFLLSVDESPGKVVSMGPQGRDCGMG